MQRCGKYISAAVNQRATIEEAVFSLGAAPRLYKDDLTQLDEMPSIFIREKPIFSSERMLHKDYCRKRSSKKKIFGRGS
jgi:hypothetical protein